MQIVGAAGSVQQQAVQQQVWSSMNVTVSAKKNKKNTNEMSTYTADLQLYGSSSCRHSLTQSLTRSIPSPPLQAV
jgi:hypothetical protein